MARTKNQEVIRRVGVASRESGAPGLAVQADQSTASGYQGLSRVAIQAFGAVSQAVAERSQRKYVADAATGDADRMTADATGNKTPVNLEDQTKGYRLGYQKADAAIAVRDWQDEVRQAVLPLEPGTDISPIMAEQAKKLMENPAFADPQVKQAMLPVIARAQDNVRQQWKQAEIKEIFTRQQESLTELAAGGIKDGSLLTDAGMTALYDNLNTEQYAYLNHRDVNDIVADAAQRVLVSGSRDPQEVLAFLDKKLPGADVSLMSGKNGDAIRAAAARGATVRQKAEDDHRDQVLADNEFRLQGMAEKGLLTDKAIQAETERFGLTGKDALGFKRHWGNEQDQTLRRWEADAKQRNAEARMLAEIRAGNPFNTPKAKLEKLAGSEWEKAPQERRGALISKYSQLGIEIPQIKNMLERTTPGAANWDAAVRTYEALREVNPTYAAQHLSTASAGMMEQYWNDTRKLGMKPQDSVAGLQASPSQKADAKTLVTQAWKEGMKPHLEYADEKLRSPQELMRIRELAENIQTRTPQIAPENAINAAVGMVDTNFTTVAGQRVLNLGMPKGAEKATEGLIGDIKTKLVAAGKLKDSDTLYAQPNPHYPGQWQITTARGWPVADPDTGNAIGFSPGPLAAARHDWENRLANSKAMKESAYRAAYKGATWQNSREADYDEALQLPKKIAELEKAQTQNFVLKSGAQPSANRELQGMKDRWSKIEPASRDIENISPDFLTFIQGTK